MLSIGRLVPEKGVDVQNIPDNKVKDFRIAMYKRRGEFLTKVNHTVMPFQNSAWPPIDKKWQDWNEEFRKKHR